MTRWKWYGVACIAATAFVVAGVAYGVSRVAYNLATGAATDTTAVGMADSSNVLDTSRCARLSLYIKPDKPCRIAIQVRAHGDSISGSGAPALTDTSKTYAWPWRGMMFATQPVDSTAWTEILGAPAAPRTAFRQGMDEYVVDFREDAVAAAGKKWVGPRGKVIDLVKLDSGAAYWAPNTSVRWRVLSCDGSSNPVVFKISLQGYTF